MRTLLAFVGSIVTMCMLAGCGPSTAPTGPTPTPARPTSFGVITESSASLGSSFSTCLSGSAAPSCFSARIRLGSIAVSAATAPTTPLNLVATSLGNSVTLSWSAPGAGDPVTSYVIEAGSAPGLANLANFSTGRALTVFGASGVGAGTYYVRVRAANAAGTSAPSNEAVLVVGGSPGVPPGAPTGLTIILNSGGTVGLAWNASSGSPTTYIIEAGSQPGLANLANSDLGSAATTLTATGVGAGTYYVRVRAKNALGISGPSNEIAVTVVAVGTPAGITIVAFPIAAGRGDTSSHGITLSVDGRPVTTTFMALPVPAVLPRFRGTLTPGTHQVVATMTSWDSLNFEVGSNPVGSVDATSFVLVSSNWTLTPLFAPRVGCTGRVLFAGRSTGSITFRFNVVAGTAASACPSLGAFLE